MTKYTLITSASCENGNKSIFGQVMFAGEIVKTGERCCEGGRKYWRWNGVKWEDDLELQQAINRAIELGLEPNVHAQCQEHSSTEIIAAINKSLEEKRNER